MDSRVDGWSEARYWSFIRSLLRKGFSRYPNKYKTLARAKKGRNQYECNICKKVYGKKDVAVDHISPCGQLKSYSDLAEFADKLFCSIDGLQVACTSCHYIKSMRERGMTDQQIASAQFRKLKASAQKRWIEERGEVPGKNAEERTKQYLRLL